MLEPKDDELPAIPSLDKYKTAQEAEVEDLIERSSLGTPGAQELRARTDPDIVDKILRQTGVMPAEDHIAPVIDIGEGSPLSD